MAIPWHCGFGRSNWLRFAGEIGLNRPIGTSTALSIPIERFSPEPRTAEADPQKASA